MPELNTDILIVGGGPAGAAAAISLRQNSPYDVTLIDKADFPRDKACGDGLSPGITNLVRELDVSEIFDDLPLCNNYTIIGPDNTLASGEIETMGIASDFVGGHVIPRYVFDSALLDKAKEHGVKVLCRHSFKSLEQHESGVSITAAQSGQDAQPAQDTQPDQSSQPNQDTQQTAALKINARIIIGADGANSRVRAALNQKPPSAKNTGIAMRAYGELTPASNHDLSRLWIVFHQELLPAYAWLFPFANRFNHSPEQASASNLPQATAGASMANIGIGCLVHDEDTSRSWFLDHLDNFVRQLQAHGIEFASISDEKTYLLPHGGKLPRLAHNRAALIGDAGCMINPLSGEGIYYGMSAGCMLAQSLLQHNSYVKRNEPQALKAWEVLVRKRFDRHLRHSYLSHKLMRNPRWARLLIQTMKDDPKIAQKAIQLMLNEGTMNPTSFAKMGLRFLRPSGKSAAE